MIRCYTIEDMVEIQHELNQLVTRNMDNVWWKALTPEHFKTQVHMEGAEVLDETGVKFKWWKKSPDSVNWFKIKMELIDIFHFYISGCMQYMYHRNLQIPGSFKTLITDNPVQRASAEFVNDDNEINHLYFNELMLRMKFFDNNIAGGIDWLLDAGNMSGEEFSAIYAAKATLNDIRVHQGYGEGSYTNKPTNGMEDSMRLEPIIDAFNRDQNMTLQDVVDSVKEEFFTVVN